MTDTKLTQPMRTLRAIYYLSLDHAVLEKGEQAAPLKVFPLKVPAQLSPLEIAKMFVKQLADKWNGIGFPRAGRKGDLLFLDADDIPNTESMYIVDDRVIPLDPHWNMDAWYATPLPEKLRGYRYCIGQKLYRLDEKLPGEEGFVPLADSEKAVIDQFVDERAAATQAVIDKATGKSARKPDDPLGPTPGASRIILPK